MKKVLLLIDIQNDYFIDGRNPLANSDQAALQAKQVLAFFRKKHLPIFHIQHISLQENATFFLPNSNGCNIHESVYPEQDEQIIVKHTPDSFFQTDLHKQLSSSSIKQLFICGMMSHMCIDTSVRSAKRLGYNIILIDNACATKDLIWKRETIPAAIVHKIFMASLQGAFAKVVDTSNLYDII